MIRGNEILTTFSDRANHIAEYFQSISNESLKNNPDGFEKLLHSTINTGQNEEYNKPIILQEMITALSNVKNTSPGEDEIPYLLIKNLKVENKREILYMYNTCLQTGYFPDKWKVGLVIPIYKPGKPKDEISSYS